VVPKKQVLIRDVEPAAKVPEAKAPVEPVPPVQKKVIKRMASQVSFSQDMPQE